MLYVAPVDSVEYVRFVRQDTAELATYLLSDKTSGQSPAFLSRAHSRSLHFGRDEPVSEAEADEDVLAPTRSSDTIPEASEPSSPETVTLAPTVTRDDGPSILASMLRQSPTERESLISGEESTEEEGSEADEPFAPDGGPFEEVHSGPRRLSAHGADEVHSETTPLLPRRSRDSGRSNGARNGAALNRDLESQKSGKSMKWSRRITEPLSRTKARMLTLADAVREPKTWDRRRLWENIVVAPVVCLPAVIVGLLLNILDALSYGMILFPLGSPIFASLGSAGISMFYVSTIVAQLTFSAGSIFRGAVGSELIEVVPFFHSMAATITDLVGEGDPEAVIATTITSYALSSMLTGTVFYLMGRFKFGYLVGFIPRHILIGCIGGVGWFLVATGFEVTARMEGSLNYDLDTLSRLLQTDTVPLWAIPLTLAIVLFYGQTRMTSKYFLPLYIIAIPAIFYFFVLSLDALRIDALRGNGWIFEGPPPGEPWWYFYTLYSKSISVLWFG